MSQTAGVFVVTHAESTTTVLRDVYTGQIYTLDTNPGVGADDVVLARLDPADVTQSVWTVDTMVEYPLTIDVDDDDPPNQARRTVQNTEVGTLERLEQSWGERHVLTVPDATQAIMDIIEDTATRSRAAKLGARHVIIRGADGVVCIDYRRDSP